MKVKKEKLDAYLKKIHGSACPLCGNNKWEISDQVFQAVEFSYKGLLVGGSSFPMVPLTCAFCGNTYFINALVAKLIDPKEPTESDLASKTDPKESGDNNG